MPAMPAPGNEPAPGLDLATGLPAAAAVCPAAAVRVAAAGASCAGRCRAPPLSGSWPAARSLAVHAAGRCCVICLIAAHAQCGRWRWSAIKGGAKPRAPAARARGEAPGWFVPPRPTPPSPGATANGRLLGRECVAAVDPEVGVAQRLRVRVSSQGPASSRRRHGVARSGPESDASCNPGGIEL